MYLFLLLAIPFMSDAQTDAQRAKNFNINSKGIAIEGYDPVAYLANQKAVKGDEAITYTYKGVKYAFASSANREKFKANPAIYEPMYGGWCAYAMGNTGEKVEIDPETFKIINGRVYLFYNFYFNNTLKSWNKNEGPLKQKADSNWQKFITK